MALVIGTPGTVPAPPQDWGSGGLPVPVSGGRPQPRRITPADVRIWPCAPIMITGSGK